MVVVQIRFSKEELQKRKSEKEKHKRKNGLGLSRIHSYPEIVIPSLALSFIKCFEFFILSFSLTYSLSLALSLSLFLTYLVLTSSHIRSKFKLKHTGCLV